MPSARTVLICGAGPAGMAAARLLHRDGWTVTIVERAPDIRSGGYAVDLRDEGLEVAGELGILDSLRRAETGMTGTDVLDRDGNVVDRLPAEEFAGQLEVPKPHLVEALFTSTRDDVEFLFGSSIAAVDRQERKVEVTLDDGSSRTVDLVVGADSLWSRTRRLLFGDDAGAVRHLGLSGAGFTAPNLLGLDHAGVLRAVDGTAVYAFSAADRARTTVSLTFATASAALDRATKHEQQTATRTAFAGQGWRVPELLDAMTAADDFYFASACQVQLSTWSKGPVVLLGDAACCAAPTSGMGTTQALVAARALAHALSEHDVDEALAAYEQRVRPFAVGNQALGAEGAARFGA